MKKLIVFLLVLAVSAANALEPTGLIFSTSFEVCDNIDEAPEGAVFWDGGGDGESWNDALNWDGDVLPAEGDDVSINVEGDEPVVIVFDIVSDVLMLNSLDSCESILLKRGTLELSGNSRVRSDLEIANSKLVSTGDFRVHGNLTQTSGSVSGEGAILIGRQFLWSGGSQGVAGSAHGTTAASGGVVISGTGIRYLRNRSLTLNGPSTWISGSFYLYDGNILNVNAPLDIQSDQNMTHISGSLSTLNIGSAITKSAGTGISKMEFNLNNDGTVTVNSGELWLGRTNAVGTSAGDFVVDSGAFLGLGGSNTLPGGSTFTGAGGLIFFAGGTTIIEGGYDLEGPLDVRSGTLEFSSHESITDNVSVKAGTLKFDQGATITGAVTFTSGTLEFGAASSISGDVAQANGTLVASGDLPVGGGYTQSSGTLTGGGTVTVTGLYEWSGGSQGAAGSAHGTTVANGGVVISGTGIRYLRNRSLTLNGSSTWTGGSFYLYDGNALNVNAPLDIQSDQNMTHISGALSTLNNTSTITKSAGTGISKMEFNLNNNGTVTVNSGELWLGRASAVGTSTGNFVVGSGAFLGLGGSNTVSGGSTFTGAGGLIFFAGGTTVIAGGYDLGGPLDVRHGTLEFSSHENITGDVLVKTGTLDFVQGATITGDVTLTSGTLDFGAASSIGGDVAQANGTLVASGVLPVGGGYAQSSGTLSGGGTVTVTGLYDWSGGNQGVSGLAHGTTVANGGMVISGTGIRYLRNRSLTLNGSSTWTGGSFYLYDGNILDVNAPLDIQSNQNMTHISGTLSTLNNTSTITKSAGTGISKMEFNLNNSGTVTVNSGELWLGRADAVGTSTGDFVVGSGAFLGLGGSNTFSGESTFTGAGGLIFFAGGTTVIEGGYDLGGPLDVRHGTLEFSSHENITGDVLVKTGTFGFEQGATITGDVTLTSGTLDFGAASSISGNVAQANGTLIASGDLPVGGGYVQSGGTLYGGGTVTVTGLYEWSGGNQGASGLAHGTTVANGGMVISGTGIRYLRNRSLTLNGSSTWTGGSFYLYDGNILNVNAPLDIQSNQNMTHITGTLSTLNNTSTITKSAGAGISKMEFNPNNSGAVTVNSGELWLGRSDSVGTSTGGFVVGSGAFLGLGGSNTLPGGSTFAGAGGLIFFAGGTTTIAGGYDLGGPLDVRHGTLEFSTHENITGDVLVKTGTLDFEQGATITGDVTLTSGTFELAAASSISGNVSLANGNLIASGDLPVGGGYVQSGGTLYGGGTVTVTGLYEWSGGNQGASGLAHGTTVANGSMVISGTGIRYLRNRSLTLNGSSTWTGGSFYLYDGNILNVNAPLDIQSDQNMTHITGAISIFNNNSDLTKTSGAGLTRLGFDINNTGTISVSDGTVQFDKQFVQTNTGVLAVKVGSTGHDSYETLGDATLDGELDINLLNGYTPTLGASFEIMTFASRSGEFFPVTGTDIGNGTHFEVSYSATNVVLTVVSD